MIDASNAPLTVVGPRDDAVGIPGCEVRRAGEAAARCPRQTIAAGAHVGEIGRPFLSGVWHSMQRKADFAPWAEAINGAARRLGPQMPSQPGRAR